MGNIFYKNIMEDEAMKQNYEVGSKNIEMQAYEFMTSGEQKTISLPVKLKTLKSVCKLKDWRLLTYAEGKDFIENFHLEYKLEEDDGFSCLINNQYVYILYNGALTLGEQVRVIAHEIGHIVLEHTCYGFFGISSDPAVTAMQEAEANEFMYYYLAPPLVLRECGVKTVDEIEKMTYLNRTDSRIILTRIKHDPVTVNEERQLLEQFAGFIKTYKWQKHTRKIKAFFKKPTPYIMTTLCLAILISGMFAGSYISHMQGIVPAITTESPQPTQTEIPAETQAPPETEVPQATTPPSSNNGNGSSSNNSGGSGNNRSSGGSSGSSGGTNPAPQQPQQPQQPAATPYQAPATPQPTPIPTQPPAVAPDAPQGQTVWVAPSGSVYHTRRNCQSIVNNANVKEYDISEVANLPRCKHCIRNGG